MNVSAESRIVSAISFGVFCRFAPSTSAIIRSRNLARLGRDADDQPSDSTRVPPVTALRSPPLTDDRGRLAGDRRLVHRRDALDDLAIGRDHFSRPDDDEVALRSSVRDRADSVFRRAPQPLARVCSVRLAVVGLRLAATLRHRFREVGEEHGEPEPERQLEDEATGRSCGEVPRDVVSTRRPG